MADVGQRLAADLDEAALRARGIAPLRHRQSRGVHGGYIANGCWSCDALIGRFRVEDLLRDHVASGGARSASWT